MWIKMAYVSLEWLYGNRLVPHITKKPKSPRENVSTYPPIDTETFGFTSFHFYKNYDK